MHGTSAQSGAVASKRYSGIPLVRGDVSRTSTGVLHEAEAVEDGGGVPDSRKGHMNATPCKRGGVAEKREVNPGVENDL